MQREAKNREGFHKRSKKKKNKAYKGKSKGGRQTEKHGLLRKQN